MIYKGWSERAGLRRSRRMSLERVAQTRIGMNLYLQELLI
jgi:hypothetical protein